MNCKWYLLNWTEIIFLVVWQRPWLSKVCKLLTAQCTKILSMWTHSQCLQFCFSLMWSCETLSTRRIRRPADRSSIPIGWGFYIGFGSVILRTAFSCCDSSLHLWCTTSCWMVVMSQDSSAWIKSKGTSCWAQLCPAGVLLEPSVPAPP